MLKTISTQNIQLVPIVKMNLPPQPIVSIDSSDENNDNIMYTNMNTAGGNIYRT